MVKIVVNLPETERRKVKAKAAMAGLSVSEAARRLLALWVDGKIDLENGT